MNDKDLRIWRNKPKNTEVRPVAFLNGPLVGTWWINIEYGRKAIEYKRTAFTEPLSIYDAPIEQAYYELYEIEDDDTHVYVLGDKDDSFLGES